MRKVLLLEDDPNLGMILEEHLQMNDFVVQLCTDGKSGLEAFAESEFDLCLVDVMMPQMDGFTFARQIRQGGSTVPIIFLTARAMKEDRIEGFKSGCDDYLTKPFSMEELLLRIEAVLRRTVPQKSLKDLPTDFDIASYSFDYNRQLLKGPDKEIKLTPRESDLLRLLCIHLNDTLDRSYALKQIWGDENYFSGRSMDVFISRLRKYLKDDQRIQIMGIHGKGFRLIVD